MLSATHLSLEYSGPFVHARRVSPAPRARARRAPPRAWPGPAPARAAATGTRHARPRAPPRPRAVPRRGRRPSPVRPPPFAVPGGADRSPRTTPGRRSGRAARPGAGRRTAAPTPTPPRSPGRAGCDGGPGIRYRRPPVDRQPPPRRRAARGAAREHGWFNPGLSPWLHSSSAPALSRLHTHGRRKTMWRAAQWWKRRTPVYAIAMPYSSQAARTSASRAEPPGCAT